MSAHARKPPFRPSGTQIAPVPGGLPVADSASQQAALVRQHQDGGWASLKNLRAGPVSIDFGGQLRLRFERDEGFTIKGYEPDGQDDLLLERAP